MAGTTKQTGHVHPNDPPALMSRFGPELPIPSRSVGHTVPRIMQHDNLLRHYLHRRTLCHCIFTEGILFVSQNEITLNSVPPRFSSLMTGTSDHLQVDRADWGGIVEYNTVSRCGRGAVLVTASSGSGMMYTRYSRCFLKDIWS